MDLEFHWSIAGNGNLREFPQLDKLFPRVKMAKYANFRQITSFPVLPRLFWTKQVDELFLWREMLIWLCLPSRFFLGLKYGYQGNGLVSKMLCLSFLNFFSHCWLCCLFSSLLGPCKWDCTRSPKGSLFWFSFRSSWLSSSRLLLELQVCLDR